MTKADTADISASRGSPLQAERFPGGYVVGDAIGYAPAMDPPHATIEEFAAERYVHRDSGETDWQR